MLSQKREEKERNGRNWESQGLYSVLKTPYFKKKNEFSKFWEICQNWLFCHFFEKKSPLGNGWRYCENGR